MNTLEKCKLEAIVASKLKAAKNIYSARREAEKKALIAKCDENMPAQVQKLAASFVELTKKRDKVESQAKDLGYCLGSKDGQAAISLADDRHWENGSYVHIYNEPSLVAHSSETSKQLHSFDDLLTNYSVKIWSDGEDMGKVLASFKQDLKAIA